jgi:hypothetical protein
MTRHHVSLSDLFSRRRKDDGDGQDSAAPALPTKALARFLAALGSRSQPLLLDLGPVVGANVTFFGEQLGCKILVEDVFKDLERHVREGRLEHLPSFLETRYPQETGTVDGILCWDIFDYLDKASAKSLAQQLVRLLGPDGVMLAMFNASEPVPNTPATFTRHVVVDPANLRHKSYPSARPRQRPMQNRDIQRLFEPLVITDQFLLKTNVREVLFRRPSRPGVPAPTAGKR